MITLLNAIHGVLDTIIAGHNFQGEQNLVCFSQTNLPVDIIYETITLFCNQKVNIADLYLQDKTVYSLILKCDILLLKLQCNALEKVFNI